MTLTVRPRGELWLPEGEVPLAAVTATVWFDQDDKSGPWGGIIEAADGAPVLRARLAAGESRYRLRLADGRSGLIDLAPSQFEADGSRPLTFTGLGTLDRPGK